MGEALGSRQLLAGGGHKAEGDGPVWGVPAPSGSPVTPIFITLTAKLVLRAVSLRLCSPSSPAAPSSSLACGALLPSSSLSSVLGPEVPGSSPTSCSDGCAMRARNDFCSAGARAAERGRAVPSVANDARMLMPPITEKALDTCRTNPCPGPGGAPAPKPDTDMRAGGRAGERGCTGGASRTWRTNAANWSSHFALSSLLVCVDKTAVHELSHCPTGAHMKPIAPQACKAVLCGY